MVGDCASDDEILCSMVTVNSVQLVCPVCLMNFSESQLYLLSEGCARYGSFQAGVLQLRAVTIFFYSLVVSDYS